MRGDGPTAVQSKLGHLLSGPQTLSPPLNYDTVISMRVGNHSGDPGKEKNS